MPKEFTPSHGQTTELHETVFPTFQFFVSSNTTEKNMSMFVHSAFSYWANNNFSFLYHYQIEKHSSLKTNIKRFGIVNFKS